jgi:hypothetical protein
MIGMIVAGMVTVSEFRNERPTPSEVRTLW